MEIMSIPWPWYIGGPLIGLMVPLLLWIGNRSLGVSSSLRHVCAACIPAKIPFFQYNWRQHSWNLFFVGGIALGGFLTYLTTPDNYAIELAASTKRDLSRLGISDFSGMVPAEVFNLNAFSSSLGWIFMVIGGFMIGFGTRYADGCTSGHTITGISNLKLASLVATAAFFAGGLMMTHFILPYLM